MARNDNAAEAAAKAAERAASEAGRVLQERQQARSEAPDPSPERTLHLPKKSEVVLSDAESEANLAKARKNVPNKKGLEEIRRTRADQDGSLESLEKNQPEEPEKPAKPAAAPAKAPEAPAAPAAESTVAAAAAQQPEQPAAPEAPKTVRVKIDGVESDVSESEVNDYGGVKAYQIAKAAENRLAKANESLAESRKMQQAMADLMARANPPKPTETDAQFIASRMEKVRFGTEEESAAAMQEILARSRPQIDQNAVVLQATTSMKRDNAMAQFAKEFQDVASQPMLKILVANLEHQKLAQYVPNGQVNWAALATLDWDNFYRTIGNEVRSVLGPRQPQPAQAAAALAAPTTGSTSLPSEKEARKASIVNLPTASARAELPEESKPESREESLNRLRKSRGQPTI